MSAQDDAQPGGGLPVTLSAAQDAIWGVVSAAKEAGETVAVGVVDEHGLLVAFARMDRALPRWVRHAQRKAYTAAIMGRSTAEFGVELRRRGHSLGDYGDTGLTTLPGGTPVTAGERGSGGVGVTGASAERDAELSAYAASRLQGSET